MIDSDDSSGEGGASSLPPVPGTLAGNTGDPIMLTDVQVDGVAASNARGGEMLKVWTRLAITSDDPAFHRVATSLAAVIRNHCQAAGTYVDIERTNVILLVIRPDKTAELWMDTAAIRLDIVPKRAVQAGTAFFERDIVDVTAMVFPLVRIGKDDKVICLFREGWRFGLVLMSKRERVATGRYWCALFARAKDTKTTIR
jgi:hypothetical protein